MTDCENSDRNTNTIRNGGTAVSIKEALDLQLTIASKSAQKKSNAGDKTKQDTETI